MRSDPERPAHLLVDGATCEQRQQLAALVLEGACESGDRGATLPEQLEVRPKDLHQTAVPDHQPVTGHGAPGLGNHRGFVAEDGETTRQAGQHSDLLAEAYPIADRLPCLGDGPTGVQRTGGSAAVQRLGHRDVDAVECGQHPLVGPQPQHLAGGARGERDGDVGHPIRGNHLDGASRRLRARAVAELRDVVGDAQARHAQALLLGAQPAPDLLRQPVECRFRLFGHDGVRSAGDQTDIRQLRHAALDLLCGAAGGDTEATDVTAGKAQHGAEDDLVGARDAQRTEQAVQRWDIRHDWQDNAAVRIVSITLRVRCHNVGLRPRVGIEAGDGSATPAASRR